MILLPSHAVEQMSASRLGIVRFSSSQSRVRKLPPPKPVWSWRKSDVQAASENARRRKAMFTDKHAIRLETLRPELESLLPERARLGREQNRISDAIQQLSGRKSDRTSLGVPEHQAKSGQLADLQNQARNIKQEAQKVAKQIDDITSESLQLRLALPNWTHPEVPVGAEQEAKIVATGGNSALLPENIRKVFQQASIGQAIKHLDDLERCAPAPEKDHVALATKMGWMNTQASQTVTGSSWPFLLGPLALLEHALVTYALEKAVRKGFTPVVVPDVVKRDILSRTGFSPREGSAGQIYWLGEDGKEAASNRDESDDLGLSATAEISLAGLCAGTTYEAAQLPLQLVAASHAFRAEAGARGLESRGLYRVHQFTKVEMFVICQGSESESWLTRLRAVQQDILEDLHVPFRVLDMPSEELGASAYRKYDMEVWMPGRGGWGEVSSASNCTEYQSRRLMIRYKSQSTHESSKHQSITEAGLGNAWAHTLNATAVAIPRLIVALLENYGISDDKKIRLPRSLLPYWIGDKDAVQWVDDHSITQNLAAVRSSEEAKSNASSPFQAAIDRVRAAARRSGSDPASMVASFLLLHEITAIVPLLLMFYAFYFLGAGESIVSWLQDASEDDNPKTESAGFVRRLQASARQYVQEGIQRAEKFGRRKGYFGFEQGSEISTEQSASVEVLVVGTFANAVAAYAVVKLLFPLRIAACIAFAGPFARSTIEPIKRLISRWRSHGHKH